MSTTITECSTCEHYDSCPRHGQATTGESTIPEALSRADQAAWEAPALRSTFTPDGQTEKWAYPCPEWCSGEGVGHEEGRVAVGRRQHQSRELLVRHDAVMGYYDVVDGREGVRSGNIAVSLVSGSRQSYAPGIQMVLRYGHRVEGRNVLKTFRTGELFPDEVRELIAVLQHLLKVSAT